MNEIKSPCISSCTKDENGICLGCYRSIYEIRKWYKATNKEKLEIIKNSDNRRLEMTRFIP